jgi:hypothetical protein
VFKQKPAIEDRRLGQFLTGDSVKNSPALTTIEQFNNIYGSYIPKNSGYYFPQVTYSSTLKGSV